MPHLTLIRWTADVCVAGAVFGCIYALLASLLAFSYTRKRRNHAGLQLPLTILKPLTGAEPRLFSQLASFCNQDYAAPVQIVFGTADESDPAINVAERLKKALPDQTIDIISDRRIHGANRKISNLVNMMPAVQHDVLVIADSDIKVQPNYLADIMGELQEPNVGAVTCLYYGIGGAGLWSRVAATSINMNFLPQVIIALSFKLAHPCLGATIAMRRETLDRIGGFAAFAEFLAEDYAIGQAVRSLGKEVIIPPFAVGHVCFERNFSSLFAQQLRFARTIRSIDPVGYAGSIIVHPLPLTLIAALLGASGIMPLLAVVLICRSILCVSIGWALRFSGQSFWLIPIQDLISFVAYAVGFFGSAVSWRGQTYRVLPDGRLAPDHTEGGP